MANFAIMKNNNLFPYSNTEEKYNVYTHLLGFILSCLSIPILYEKGNSIFSEFGLLSFMIFGISMMILYLASTLYHASKTINSRKKLKIFDHCAIYILIAGTYTPFALVTLRNDGGLTIFTIIWSLAIAGICLKIFFTGKFKIISTIIYIVMGWLIVFYFSDLMNNMDKSGIVWLVSGGISYTIGALLYSIKKIPYNHAIFHVFVIIGTICHFISIINYVK